MSEARNKARLGEAGHGKAWLGRARNEVRRGEARRGRARNTARLG